jgi:hypothetical protein
MKKLLEDFKKLDMPTRFIMVGTPIAMVGYFFGDGGNSDFWDVIMWIGASIGIFGWL